MAVVKGKIYVLGGEEGWDRYHDSVECYDPEQNKWQVVAEMTSSRSWLACVGLTVSDANKIQSDKVISKLTFLSCFER